MEIHDERRSVNRCTFPKSSSREIPSATAQTHKKKQCHSPAGKASSPPVTHDESANLPGSPADMNGKEEKQDVEMKGSEPRDKLKNVDENSKSRDIKYDPFSDDDEDISHSDKDQGRKKRSSRRKSSEKEPEKDPVRAVDESSQDSTSKKEKASWKDEMISKHPKLVDLVKYWKPVKADPSDFQGWTYLLQYVDQENDVEAAQEVYDSFLSRYPYCYGYWKKYADYMKKKAMKKDCEMVFNKGLKAIPLSVDLWLHYLNYCKAHHAPRESFVRDTFEDAINTCGLEFRSDRLWELYINWELEKDRLDRVFAIYDRLIRIPTQFHKTHWENFEDLVKQHNPKELLLPSELLSFRMSLHDEKKLLAETEGDAPPGDEAEAPGSDTSKKMTDEEIDAIKRKIRESRKEVHKKTETMISERFAFEEAIKRPYFHVKPLERGQLKNWREYLDFEISFRGYLGDEERIRILFERCLIACALYEEFWIKYAKYTETKDTYKVDYTRSIYDRACNIHLQKRPGIHLQWAAFEEKHGNEEKSAEILNKMVGLFPSLEIVLLRRINLERRRGHLNSALAFYKKAIITAGSTSTGSNLSIRAARFASKVLGNASEAEEILSTAVEKDPKNPRLYLQLTDLYMHQVPFDFTAVLKALNKALSAPLDLQDKLRFAQRKLQFVEDFAPFVTDLHEAEKEYSDLAREVREKMPKREAEPQSLKGEPDTKKAREAYTPALPTTAYSTSAATPYTSASYTNQYNYGSSYGTNYAGSTYNPATYQQGSTWYNQGSYGYGYGNYPYTGY